MADSDVVRKEKITPELRFMLQATPGDPPVLEQKWLIEVYHNGHSDPSWVEEVWRPVPVVDSWSQT